MQNFGEIVCAKKHFVISAKNGALEILRCQASGGKVLDAAAFLNGFRFKSGFVDAVEETNLAENFLLNKNAVHADEKDAKSVQNCTQNGAAE